MTEQTDQAAVAELDTDGRGFVAVVAKNIRRLAFEAEVTISELANAIDLRQPALSKRLNGTVEWSLSDVLMVARHFGVKLSDIAPDSLTEGVIR